MLYLASAGECKAFARSVERRYSWLPLRSTLPE